VNIRVLGVLRQVDRQLTFVPSHRRLPNVGSPVAIPTPRVLREIAGHSDSQDAGAALGFLAMGEFIWARRSDDTVHPRPPAATGLDAPAKPRCAGALPCKKSGGAAHLHLRAVGLRQIEPRETPVFGAVLATTPTIEKRGGRTEPVGALIFDRDGEYFWPDDKGRPGLCDVPHLQDHLVVFTDREAPSGFYGSFVAGKVKLDIRRLPAAMVVGTALPPRTTRPTECAQAQGA
jgi:hypothetical protein